jgi:hypothetical protein
MPNFTLTFWPIDDMRNILNEYIETELTASQAKLNLEKIREAKSNRLTSLDLNGNMHDIAVNLSDKRVNITGIMADDPEMNISLEKFIGLMNDQMEILFCGIGQHLILKRKVIGSDGNTLSNQGEEFIVEDIIGFGFDLVHALNTELFIRVINSDMDSYFRLK